MTIKLVALILLCLMTSTAMEKGIGGAGGANFINQTELVSLIDNVQTALKSI